MDAPGSTYRPARGRGGAARQATRGRGIGRSTTTGTTAAPTGGGSGSTDGGRSEGQSGRGKTRGGGRGRAAGRNAGGRNVNSEGTIVPRPKGAGAEDVFDAGSNPADLARQAKQWAGALSELLKKNTPWHPEVEQLRMRIRKRYQAILLQYPTSPISQSIEPLWIFTSHILIGSYRLIIAEFEKRVQEVVAQRAAISNEPRRGRGRGNGRGTLWRNDEGEVVGPGPVEMRKLLSRFKGFLNSEQTYYRGLIRDVVDAFGLKAEVEGYLEVLKIPLRSEDEERAGGRQPGHTGLSSEERARGATPTGRRTPTPAVATPPPVRSDLTRDEVVRKIGMVHKALICLGDLERYREQYDSDKEKKAPVVPKGKTVVKGDIPLAQEQYAGAKRYYEVARGLLPENGNPSNQLAVISSYCQDTFSAIYHYFRALTVQDPFLTAEYNLAKTLRKALREWEAAKSDAEGIADSDAFPDLVAGNEVGSLKREEVILQAIMYNQDDCSRLQPLVQTHLEHFGFLLKDRQVPSEIIVKTLVLGIMGHWHAKINHVADSVDGSAPNATTFTGEYLLGVARVVLQVAISELEAEMGTEGVADYNDEDISMPMAPVFEDDEDEDDMALHKHISAVMRRMLPAMRIFSKWLKSNQDQVKALLENTSSSVVEARTRVQDTARGFWQAYFDFLGRLEWIFPIERLPKLSDQLEEDYDMKGLSPLARGMWLGDIGADSQSGGQDRKRPLSEVHPNEEQLMRVSDLLIDGKMLLQGDVGRCIFVGRFARRIFTTDSGRSAVTLDPAGKTPPARAPLQLSGDDFHFSGISSAAPPFDQEREADLASVSTETEDDPVNLAMRATMLDGSSLADDDDERSMLGESSDDEEEKVLWDAAANAFDPHRGVGGSVAERNTPPARAALPSGSTSAAPGPAFPTTAQSLLHSLMSGQPAQATMTTPTIASGTVTKRSSIGNAPGSSALLFGSGAGMSPSTGSNIWSTGTGMTPAPSGGMLVDDTSGPGQVGTGPGGAFHHRSSVSAQLSSVAGGGASGLNPNPWGPPSSPSGPGWGGLGNGSSRFGTPLMGSSGTPPSGTSGGFGGPNGAQTQYNPTPMGETIDGYGSVPMPMPRAGSMGSAAGPGLGVNVPLAYGATPPPPPPGMQMMGSHVHQGQQTGPGVIGQGFRLGPGGGAGWG